MIKLVAFDLDGTIADTIPMCIEAFKQAVSPYASKILIPLLGVCMVKNYT